MSRIRVSRIGAANKPWWYKSAFLKYADDKFSCDFPWVVIVEQQGQTYAVQVTLEGNGPHPKEAIAFMRAVAKLLNAKLQVDTKGNTLIGLDEGYASVEDINKNVVDKIKGMKGRIESPSSTTFHQDDVRDDKLFEGM